MHISYTLTHTYNYCILCIAYDIIVLLHVTYAIAILHVIDINM